MKQIYYKILFFYPFRCSAYCMGDHGVFETYTLAVAAGTKAMLDNINVWAIGILGSDNTIVIIKN